MKNEDIIKKSMYNGIAHCKGCPMDEDLFVIGMICHTYKEKQL